MAEVKKAASAAKKTTKTVKKAEPAGNATGKRVAAVIFWLFAIAFEVLGILMLFGKVNITFMPTLACIIAVLVLDLICVIVGSLFWKKANHIDPASKSNKVKFFLWNNMGVIICIIAFVPYIVLILTSKDKLDKQTKTIAVIAAIIALLIGSLFSFDYNPVSEESKAEAIATVDGTVYWSQFGKVYHIDQECQHINKSDTIYEGTAEEAIDNNRTRLCKTCAKNNGIDIEDVED